MSSNIDSQSQPEHNEPRNWLHKRWNIAIHKDNRDFALEIVKTLGIALTGVGLLFTIWKGWEDRRLTQERLITERFTKAVEQLKEQNSATVRIGGIYALERIAKAKDSKKDYYWTIMDILTSYVRENDPPNSALETDSNSSQSTESAENAPNPPSIDLQAVITVISRRDNPPKESEPESTEDVEDFPDPTEYQNREYNGSPYFIDLRTTNLQRADFDDANLEEANFHSANLRKAHLKRANLRKAVFIKANLVEAILHEADLNKALLFMADLKDAGLGNANLRGADLLGANLEGASFSYSDLRGADLGGAELSFANFSDANFSDADLGGAENLSNALLAGANLERADLSGADLEDTSSTNPNFLRNANLNNTIFDNTELNPQQIKSACFWENAIYVGEWDWDREQRSFFTDEDENKKYIEKLKQDKASDPEEPVDCSRWE